MPPLLLVDDDDAVAMILTRRLAAAGYRVDRAASWREGLSLAVRDGHHLILLDRALSEIDGLALVRILRASGLATPVLLLSASDDAEAHREALRAGADDHLAKPVANAELLARVAALARPPRKPEEPTVLRVADLALDLKKRTVVRAGRSIRLLERDFDLLAHLVRNRGRAVTRASLLQNVWDQGGDTETRALGASIERIRAKVDRGFRVELIHTVQGVGYCLLDDD
jgi:two-component system OmpR family response regulator